MSQIQIKRISHTEKLKVKNKEFIIFFVKAYDSSLNRGTGIRDSSRWETYKLLKRGPGRTVIT